MFHLKKLALQVVEHPKQYFSIILLLRLKKVYKTKDCSITATAIIFLQK